jgi:gamma-glutamyltranspeptidase/glutathione hydrolase
MLGGIGQDGEARAAMTATDEARTVASSWTRREVTRTAAVGRRGMVAAKHPAAVEAGLRVLRDGGNAVDAAVAVGFAITVVEPMSSGVGGGGFMTVRMASGEEAVFDYQVRAALAAHETMYTPTANFHADGQGFVGVEDDANFTGPRAAAVPGVVAGLALAAQSFGTRSLADLLDPAIALAEEGFAVDWPFMLSQAGRLALLRRFPATAVTYLRDGCPLTPGDETPTLFRQPDLARTLRRIAAEGLDGFYDGPTAAAISAEMERRGGHITTEDLRRYAPKRVAPPSGTLHGDRLIALPPPASGALLLESFNILERLPLAAAGYNTVEALHLTIEAFRRSHADRFAYLGDPEFQEVPIEGLIAKPYADLRRATIDPARYADAVAGDPWPFMPATAGGARPLPSGRVREEGTTSFSVIDAQGNAVAVTQTLTSGWGCGVTVPETGVLLNNAMTLFDPRPGRANSIAPRKRPASSMAHTIVVRDGEAVLVAGAPGGRRILDTVSQVLLNVLVHRRAIEDAVAGPFIDTSAETTAIDERVGADVLEGLRARGHTLRVVEPDFYMVPFARPLGISRDPATGELRGGADPYHYGVAGGF